MEEYQRVGRSLWDLMESQERNMAQLERIGAMIEQRWGSEGENRKKKIRRRELHHLSPVRLVALFFLV